MKWGSFRVRLTLWNVSVMAIVLGAFAFAIPYSVRASLAAATDQELADRGHWTARWAQDWWAPPGMGHAMRLPDVPTRTPGELPPRGRELFRRPPPVDLTGADRRGYYRRPRVFDVEGNSLTFQLDEPWDPDTFKLGLAGKEFYSTIVISGASTPLTGGTSTRDEMVRVFSTPVWRDGRVEGVVQVAHPLTEFQRLNSGLVQTLLTFIPLALLLAGLGGAFLTDRALRPVRDVTKAAAQIGEHDLSRRLHVTGKDELSELASTFNAMIARLESAFNRLEAAYEQQRRFTGDASHELRTPLTTIKANTSLALAGEASVEDYREALVAADQAADTMNRIVQDLLLLARSDSGHLDLHLETVPAEALLRQAAAVTRDAESASISVELPEEPLAVSGDRHHLMRLFVNLVENAQRHTPHDGRIMLRARAAGDSAAFTVEDTGEGIPAEHLPHVCERFYRVDSARSRARGGTGLGLSICQSIVQAHGGRFRIESEEGRGARVTVILPRASMPAPQEQPAALST